MSVKIAVSLEEAKDHIDQLDFTNIINKMVSHHGWRKKDATTLSLIYKNYLYLNKKYGDEGMLPPSEEIDEFWHNHILDTKQYIQDCKKIFGGYLDHYPYFGIDDKTDLNDLNKAFAKTQSLYLKEFGSEIINIRYRFDGILFALRRKLHRMNLL